MSHRTHRFDAWHLLAEPTFGAILAPAEGEALAELARREETARDELRRARDAEAPTPVGVAPRADADDDDDDGASRADDDDASADDDGGDDEDYEDELGLSSDGD